MGQLNGERVLLEGHAAILESIVAGAALPEVLDEITRLIEVCQPESICSILLLDRELMVLRDAAGASLPEAYRQAIDGQAIGPAAGSCGTAAFTGQPVYVSDIAADPLWADYAELAIEHGLRACWSTPITIDGEVAATFAMYSRRPREVGAEEQRVIDLSVHLVALAIRSDADRSAIVQADSRYRTLVERLPLVTYVDDVDRGHVYVSPQIEQVVGVAPEQWAAGWREMIHDDDRERVMAGYTRYRELRAGYEDEYRVVRKDGRVIWLSERATMIEDGRGGGYLQGVMYDNTQVKQAERAAVESESHFREMLEGMRLSAVVTEADGTISFCNQHFADTVGADVEWIVGRNWIATFAPPDDDSADRHFFDRLGGGQVVPFVVDTVRTGSGDLRTISWSNSPLRDDSGAITAAVRVGEDVTDRLRAERALHESEARRRLVLADMVRTAEEERMRIATELHDDTVQVMVATLIALDRLSSAIAAGDGARMADAVQTASETLKTAVDRTRILMFELRPPLLEAKGLASALTDLAETAGSEAGLEVHVEIDVGRYPELIETLAYRTVQEAITNVRKHARASQLRLVLREVDGRLEGEVVDDGFGFDVERALDHSVMRLHMGMDTMIERVRLSGGDVRVEAAPGSGTRISFEIPIV